MSRRRVNAGAEGCANAVGCLVVGFITATVGLVLWALPYVAIGAIIKWVIS